MKKQQTSKKRRIYSLLSTEEKLAVLVALRAATGALKGAIGFELIEQAQNLVPPGYTTSYAAGAQAVGATILSPISVPIFVSQIYASMSHFSYDKNSKEKNFFNSKSLLAGAIAATIVNTTFGMLENMVGDSILDSMSNSTDHVNSTGSTNFAIATGAAGGAVTTLGVIVALLLIHIARSILHSNKPSQPAMLSQFKSSTPNMEFVQHEEELPSNPKQLTMS